ncbi:hypothetical protein Tco_1364048 [Tanacetum coccineum]
MARATIVNESSDVPVHASMNYPTAFGSEPTAAGAMPTVNKGIFTTSGSTTSTVRGVNMFEVNGGFFTYTPYGSTNSTGGIFTSNINSTGFTSLGQTGVYHETNSVLVCA